MAIITEEIELVNIQEAVNLNQFLTDNTVISITESNNIVSLNETNEVITISEDNTIIAITTDTPTQVVFESGYIGPKLPAGPVPAHWADTVNVDNPVILLGIIDGFWSITLKDGEVIVGPAYEPVFDGNYSSLNGIPTFANVATTGEYGDLTGLPTTITAEQADEIAANTAKTGITSEQVTAIAANATAITGKQDTITAGTDLTFAGNTLNYTGSAGSAQVIYWTDYVGGIPGDSIIVDSNTEVIPYNNNEYYREIQSEPYVDRFYQTRIGEILETLLATRGSNF